jgi:hypothetical protein
MRHEAPHIVGQRHGVPQGILQVFISIYFSYVRTFHRLHLLRLWTPTIKKKKKKLVTSFQGANRVRTCAGNGLLPKVSVTAPPPLTMKSNQPSSWVIVYPSVWMSAWVTLTPTSPRPVVVTTRPRRTAARLKKDQKVNFHNFFKGN